MVTLDAKNVERIMMYDNQEDPYQMHNMVGENASLQKTLHNQLLEKLKEKKDPWVERYLQLRK
ncbi:MAG TPA: hypothetical protein PKC63_10185 [Mariniflexile sp.]|nr:hypothetical protein [Mariniflexile sp.]